MDSFQKVTSVVAALDRPNVDTDQIIPAEYLKRIEKSGFGPHLFERWKYLPDGSLNPSFELNQVAFEGAELLVSGANFGSGSSREHAVWALQQAGYKAVIAPSFAEIFHKNSFESGLVPVLLPEKTINNIIAKANEYSGYKLTVDLEKCEVTDDEGLRVPFVMHSDPATHELRRHRILHGLDDIGMTMQHDDDIARFEATRQAP
jgi:3-isopropylmalate/(R)-2-methylmalate dehydratase small subunit